MLRKHVELIESAQQALVMYHGSDVNIRDFSLDHIGDGHDQHGVGIYLTSSMEGASVYGKYVHKITLDQGIKLVPNTSPDKNVASRLMELSPDLDDTLMDWAENPQTAFNNALSAMADVDTMTEMFDNIWYDFYRDEPKQFLQNLINLTGYQGKTVPVRDDVTFLVLFDTSAIASIDLVE